ncbi:VOC family protein [Cellulomonas telluris]|uniref:VOC family protein n=1 Tax=Cellulomonas telluris TaxID=2306636 RepID=UPI0027958FF7|nr:VOC family protein [Cellulomonas telluris]
MAALGWVLVVAGAAVVLVLLDRAVARGWFDRFRLSVRSGSGVTGGGGLLPDFVEVFQPAHKHLVEEQERQRLDVVREGDAAPPFDLDAGPVVLRHEEDARRGAPSPSVRRMPVVVSQICIDAADPAALARWWSQVLGWPVTEEDDEEVEIAPPDGSATPWLFLRVPDERRVKNRLHPDIRPADGSDQETELARLLELGATRVDVGQGDVAWQVLADPEGNEFCLLRSTPAQLAAAEASASEPDTPAGASF